MTEQAGTKPKTIATTAAEGGCWTDFVSGEHVLNNTVHAILFEDGSVWDAFNGWRPKKRCTRCKGAGFL